MKLIRKNLHIILLYILANSIFILANIPFYQRSAGVPSGSISLYQHHDVTQDYLIYIVFIREAKKGAWRIPDLFTSETMAGTSNFLYFILLGKAAALLDLSPVIIYHAARVLQFEVFIYVLYLLLKYILGKKPGFIASLLALTAAPPAAFLDRIYYSDNFGVPAWWMTEPFRRADMLPHHSASLILILLEVYFFLKASDLSSAKLIILSVLCGFMSTMFHPISGLVPLAIQPVSVTLYSVFMLVKKRKPDKFLIISALICMLSAGLAVLTIRQDIVSTYPYNLWLNFDLWWYERYKNYTRDFILAGGPLGIFSLLPAALFLVRPKKFKYLLISVWAFLPLLLILFNIRLGIAKFRFALLDQFIPMSVLAVVMILGIIKVIKQKYLQGPVIVLVLLVYLSFTLPSFAVFYRDIRERSEAVAAETHLTRDQYDGLIYLGTHAKPYSMVFAEEKFGEVLPALAPLRTYVGDYMLTIDYESKKYLPPLFFSGQMDKYAAEDLILNNNVDYIFSDGQINIGEYGLPLVKYYEKGGVNIYQVRNLGRQKKD